MLYYTLGRYSEAELLYKRALAIHEKALGPYHLQVATVVNNLAILYSELGRDTEAEPISKRVLAIHEKSLAPNHIRVAIGLHNLALVSPYLLAMPLFERALAIDIKNTLLPHGPPNIEKGLDKFALFYPKLGRLSGRFPEPLFVVVFSPPVDPERTSAANLKLKANPGLLCPTIP